MPDKLNILAISGSTRKASSNLHLIHAIARMTATRLNISMYEGLTDLPHFNPDLDNGQPPAAVSGLLEQLRSADGILICTPEYAAGVPGSLKNAVDWAVGSMGFSGKPTALITASTSGHAGHQSLLGTLLLIEARITAAAQLVIPAVKTKVSAAGEITDPATLQQTEQLIQALTDMINGAGDQDYLKAPAFFGN